jgi:hypothetical protein
LRRRVNAVADGKAPASGTPVQFQPLQLWVAVVLGLRYRGHGKRRCSRYRYCQMGFGC